MTPAPWVERHLGLWVVRDDLLPGGTKARFVGSLFDGVDAVVYASPAQGGMQLALAYAAKRLGKQAAIFVAERAHLHPRTLEAHRAGARIIGVRPGYLSVVQARALEWATFHDARYIEFGGHEPGAEEAIAAAARDVAERYGPFPQVWCAAGSGTLTRGLQLGIPDSEHHAVQVGREPEAGSAIIHPSMLRFEQEITAEPPFPSCRNYDAKAWWLARQLAPTGSLFWNVLGPSPTPAAEESPPELVEIA